MTITTVPAAVVAGSDPGAQGVLVLGGGPIGMVCALLLARRAIACTLVDARPLEALQRDRRLLALSRGTLLVLERLLGPRFATLAPIERVLISSRGNPGSATLGAADFAGDALGATIWYADLVQALGAAVDGNALIRLQRPRRALSVLQQADRVQVRLDDDSTLSGALGIDAEGTPAQVKAPAQSAILAELTVAGGRAGDAFERFTAEGPLALLPMPGTAADRLSMIWCLPTALVRERMAMAPDELLRLINRALGTRLPFATAIGPGVSFPLVTHRRAQVCEHRVVHLGNAAQTLHPVAGQGFNLGIRDCVALADALAQAGGEVPRALAQYARARRADRRLIPGLTAALPGLFATPLAPVVAARSLALAALDIAPSLRRGVARLLMFGVPR